MSSANSFIFPLFSKRFLSLLLGLMNSNIPVRSLSMSIVTRGYVAAESGKWALFACHLQPKPDRQSECKGVRVCDTLPVRTRARSLVSLLWGRNKLKRASYSAYLMQL